MTAPRRQLNEALRLYVSHHQLALSCVTRSNVILVDRPAIGPLSLRLPQAPLRLAGNLQLDLIEVLRPESRDTGWLLRGGGYMYTLYRGGGELLAYHWHPRATSRVNAAHLHAALAEQDDRSLHLPTGTVLIEDIVGFAITELGVRPLRPDWLEVLADCRSQIAASGTWG